MHHRNARFAAVTAAVAVALSAAAGQTPLATARIAGGFENPLFVTHAPGDFERIFVVEQGSSGSARIKIVHLDSGTVFTQPFLTVSPVVTQTGEQGLLGLAFHPNYASNGWFYVYYTAPGTGGLGTIARFSVSSNPHVALPGSALTVLTIPLTGWHNGGWIGFGPDGNLYAAVGSQAGQWQAQTIVGNLRGKILRLDVNGDDFPADPLRNYAIPATNPFVGVTGEDEIWAYGLRNPWRCSFDRSTHDLWVSDVGQNAREEINFQPAARNPPYTAVNYGWPCLEGTVCDTGWPKCNCTSPLLTAPVHEYAHGGSPPLCAVTGGYVYRGCAIPDLQGTYFFGDVCGGKIWSLRLVDGQVTEFVDRTEELDPGAPFSLGSISSFGEDAFGELYICNLGEGDVFRIVPAVPTGLDCNANGRPDACDILSGFSLDGNGNGVPDECECYPNCNGDYSGGQPVLSVADFGCFQSRFVSGHQYADCSGDGTLTVADFGCFQSAFVGGCP